MVKVRSAWRSHCPSAATRATSRNVCWNVTASLSNEPHQRSSETKHAQKHTHTFSQQTDTHKHTNAFAQEMDTNAHMHAPTHTRTRAHAPCTPCVPASVVVVVVVVVVVWWCGGAVVWWWSCGCEGGWVGGWVGVLDVPSILNKLRRSNWVRLIHYSIFGLEAAEHAEPCCIETYAQVSRLAVSVTISTTNKLLLQFSPTSTPLWASPPIVECC